MIGCGGAGFPTNVKLKGTFEYLIANGAECEPLLRNDRYLMRNHAEEIIGAMETIAEKLKIPNAVIALKGHYEEEVAALRAAIAKRGSCVRIHELQSFYPAGDEQTIVYEVTGRVVPPAGLPSEVGAVVDNVATIYAVFKAIRGEPFTHKYLTVTGEVNHPAVLCVPVGTGVEHCIKLAGGAKQNEYFVILGGPMMGKTLPMDAVSEASVTKTTSGILVLPKDGYHARTNAVSVRTMLNRARSACIQCTTCSQMCPRHLLGHPLEPHRIMRTMATGIDIKEMLDDPDIRNAQLCCECGICEAFACPMGLQPRRINGMIKRELAAAEIRYERKKSEWQVSPWREERKIPQQKAAARVGVGAYYDYEISDLLTDEPERVSIPLKMSAGAPAVPCVSVGSAVRTGDLIAEMQPGKLGSNIHASISGVVKSISDRIVIVKG